jgi:hypothetical protein
MKKMEIEQSAKFSPTLFSIPEEATDPPILPSRGSFSYSDSEDTQGSTFNLSLSDFWLNKTGDEAKPSSDEAEKKPHL